MIFTCTKGRLVFHVEADSWEEAERLAAERGGQVDGELDEEGFTYDE